MKFKAEIDIMPHDNLLDPQGKAVTSTMVNLGLSEITNVRIGKHIHLEIDAPDADTASKQVDEACRKLLCNMIMESYSFELFELESA